MARTVRRRRLEAKTDYKLRLGLLKSGRPRLVIRRSNKFLTVQIIVSENAQDKVVSGVTSKVLLTKGWPDSQVGSLKNRTAAYLTGYVLGHMAKDKVKEAILDMGMHRNIQKSRIYAVLKGVIDSGLKVPCDESILPSESELDVGGKFKAVIAKIKHK